MQEPEPPLVSYLRFVAFICVCLLRIFLFLVGASLVVMALVLWFSAIGYVAFNEDATLVGKVAAAVLAIVTVGCPAACVLIFKPWRRNPEVP
jgi:hypothetical protein